MLLAWTVLLGFSCWSSVSLHKKTVENIALAEARATIGRDLLYRRWGAMHGGVYVPPTAATPPNPYLSHIPDRDVITRDGKALTLINPAYMTRQVYEMAQKDKNGLGIGHLTSLKPIRPENAPDPWEIKALKEFENGAEEVSAIVVHDGSSYLRHMRTFKTEQSCLKCHAHQGYKVGDVRGGLNVSIPIQPLMEATKDEINGTIARHGGIWLLGFLLFIAGSAKLSASAQIQQDVQDELSLQAEELEEEIAQRQKTEEMLQNQAAILEEEIAERQSAQESLQDQTTILEEEMAERQQYQEALAVKSEQLEGVNRNLENRIAETLAELRQKDQALIQQGRLASMGEMINNIAHQWRQPLNNVGLLIQNMQMAFNEGKLTPEEMDQAVDSSMKTIVYMSRTIDDFRNFFRHDKEKEIFQVDRIVNKAIDFISATLEQKGIQVKCQFTQNVTAVGYPNEYAQVLLNIISNAKDVLLERKICSPEIVITVESTGENSLVSVSDNGGGIDEAVMPKIFDPYFTTKEPGKGTGIGLYMSKIIIEQNMGGKLYARNLDGGAEFVIEL